MTFPDDDISIPGWKYNGRTTGEGIWGKYSQERELSPEQQRKLERILRDRAEQERQSLREKYEKALPIADRDRAIRAIAKAQELNLKHKADLLRRGLDNQTIDGLLFFSIKDGKPCPPGTPENLPGTKEGRLSTSSPGYACVVFDNQQRAIGWQVRTAKTSGSKYLWAKNPHLKCGELPLTFATPPKVARSRLALAEGILKPQIAARRLNQRVIGAAGGQFLNSQRQLAVYLEGEKFIDIYPDAGDLAKDQVMRRWANLIDWLECHGITVYIGWWGQNTKDHQDIDELQNLDVIQYLTPRDWLKLANRKPKRDRGSLVALQLERMKAKQETEGNNTKPANDTAIIFKKESCRR